MQEGLYLQWILISFWDSFPGAVWVNALVVTDVVEVDVGCVDVAWGLWGVEGTGGGNGMFLPRQWPRELSFSAGIQMLNCPGAVWAKSLVVTDTVGNDRGCVEAAHGL